MAAPFLSKRKKKNSANKQEPNAQKKLAEVRGGRTEEWRDSIQAMTHRKGE